MSGWAGNVERLTVPAGRECQGSSKSAWARGESCGKANGAIALVVVRWIAMAHPAELRSIWSHCGRILGAGQITAAYHTELLRKLNNVFIHGVGSCPIFVVNLVIWQLWHSDKAAVARILKVYVRHPVIALVSFRRHGTASRCLSLGKIHGGLKAITTNDGVNVPGGGSWADDRIEPFNDKWSISSFKNEIMTLLGNNRINE